VIGVPTLDMSNVTDDALAAVDLACRDHGFFLLMGHGLDAELTALKEQASSFFALPMAEKRRVSRTVDNPMGYYDRELTKQKRDLKEVFDYYATTSPKGATRMPWPENPPAFQSILSAHFLACRDVSAKVMRLLCRALGVDETALDAPFLNKHSSSARLNFYPSADPLSVEEQGEVAQLGDMALHHHTDQGAITLLHQDNVGGLQAHSPTDGWIDVPPTADALVVNIGDLVQVWSNGIYKAALHRVVPVPRGTSRYSMPFFYQPDFATEVAPLPTLGEPVYRAFTWAEFIQGRIDDNYSAQGDEDIQIERYRIAT
jgi:isopenicillin N synthase-like dioxygenase